MPVLAASSDLVDKAQQLAEGAHAVQTDKAGQPYIGHVRRVAAAVKPQEPTYITTALLHDVVEDSTITLNDLATQGFPQEVVTAVGLLTRQEHIPAEDYYQRIRANPIALAVKLADISDNANPDRLAKLDAPTRERLTEKYRSALLSLGQPALAARLGDT